MSRKGWILGGLAVLGVLWGMAGGEEAREVVAFSPTVAPVESETVVHKILEFPFVVRDTGLIVQHMAQYEGPFLESEEQEPVAQVAALMICNPGKRMVTSAELVLTQGERILRFSFTCLPPQSRILVLEAGGQLYSSEAVDSYQCLSFAEETPPQPAVQVTDSENGLEITNRSSVATTVTLYYKQYIGDGDFYLGGVTGQVQVKDLAVGESRNISPMGYAPKYCHIVKITAE